jgi:hypothetical protein
MSAKAQDKCQSTKRKIRDGKPSMRLATAVTLLVVALILLLASHLHDSAHRFDVVLAAAGSGGSQQDAGSTDATAYLVDHKTGRVWELHGPIQLPTVVEPCAVALKETERGCEAATPPKTQ